VRHQLFIEQFFVEFLEQLIFLEFELQQLLIIFERRIVDLRPHDYVILERAFLGQ
jgi:hypothetical protein